MNKPLQNFTLGAISGTAFALLVIAILLVAPFLLIWSVNTLGASIEHTPLNYLAAIVLLVLVRAGK